MARWQEIRRENFYDWRKLLEFLELDDYPVLKRPLFPLNLPLRLAAKIEKQNPEDPILRQFLPSLEELEVVPGFSRDAVGDELSRKQKKLLHKYQGRALLVCTSACVMNCRFCFRQNFSYETKETGFQRELESISADTSLSEIILSGGDPLSLTDTALGALVQELDKIPHLKRLRFHTRFPIGIPERITQSFLDILSSTRLEVFFVIHCNHPKELDEEVLSALRRVKNLGVSVLNQTVLLKGVNDSVAVLKDLCEKLVNHGILPYYLHQLDRVQGASHFEVSKEVGLSLVEQLTKEVSGYALPRYVQEIQGELSKTALS